MSKRISRTLRQFRRTDVGTLWTMARRDSSARCALMAWSGDLELCVLVDGQPLLSKRCRGADEAFTLAEQWRQRMLGKGWRQIVPAAALPAVPDGRQSA